MTTLLLVTIEYVLFHCLRTLSKDMLHK